MFDHFGTDVVRNPWGACTRWRLFDAPWQRDWTAGQEPTLVGHEQLQAEMYRALCNFAREGRANRLVLMHGPNGSAKSTAATCVLRGLERYSELDEGALFRFHWVFPKRMKGKGTIGFGTGQPAFELDSYAHLDEDDIDARLVIELRDHPTFLLPLAQRRALLDELWGGRDIRKPPRWLYEGELSHKNQQIFDALLSSYKGSLREVLRHVQIERYFVSRRYRVGAITVGPQMSVDAGERQITADRSLSALPTSLQATTLFEAYGELVDAAGGVLEFSDLLKRPIDAFRYLQMSLETGSVPLSQQTIYTNLVMIGGCNDLQLEAFRQHHEYASFRGRLELVRVPYLRSYLDEQAIYDRQIVPQLQHHTAPHATSIAAEFAVLSRMKRPNPEHYPKPLSDIAKGLTAVEKLDLFALGQAPARLGHEQRKLLRASVAEVYAEFDTETDYEGRVGMSPRSMRTLLLDAAQREGYHCLSPFAVLDELEELCKGKEENEWLQLDVLPGGYHDHAAFRRQVRERLLDRIEGDMRQASALIDEAQYGELFARYVHQVSAWVKGEKMRHPVTGKDEVADENTMREVEALLGVTTGNADHRRTTIALIAAWAIDNPGEKPSAEKVFPEHVLTMRTAAFAKLRKQFALLLRDLVELLRGEDGGQSEAQRAKTRAIADRAHALGYCDHCTLDAASRLLAERHRDLVT
jgi:serine protein kinase